MKPPYDAAVRDAVRLRMSPPNRESVTEIARDTGIHTDTEPLNAKGCCSGGSSSCRGHDHRLEPAAPEVLTADKQTWIRVSTVSRDRPSSSLVAVPPPAPLS
jgi:hypothetical protein